MNEWGLKCRKLAWQSPSLAAMWFCGVRALQGACSVPTPRPVGWRGRVVCAKQPPRVPGCPPHPTDVGPLVGALWRPGREGWRFAAAPLSLSEIAHGRISRPALARPPWAQRGLCGAHGPLCHRVRLRGACRPLQCSTGPPLSSLRHLR